NAKVFAQARIKSLKERFIEIGNCGCCRLLIDGRKRHPRAEKSAIDTVQRGDGTRKMIFEAKRLKALGMANVVQQRIKKGDGQIGVRVVNFKSRFLVRRLVPEHPGGEERIEGGLHER